MSITVIKEFCPSSNRAVIRTETYGSSVGKIELLMNFAMSDFPGLSKWDIEVVQFGGQHYKRTFGIEFPAASAPEDYDIIEHLEYRL